jgi:cardiolipin synthase
MFKEMTKAEKSIYIEMYIFLNDTQATHNFLGLLKEKSRAGLEVVIIADAIGSFSLRGLVVAELRAAGIEFIFFSHWMRRTHRKIVIIDNKVSFLGGVNIKENNRDWLDLQVKIEGKIVIPLLQSFAYAYALIGGEKESILKYNRLSLVKKIKSWIIDTFIGNTKTYNLNKYYKGKLMAAQKSIKIVTPYLLPPRRLLAALDQARLKGVEVEIIIPNNTDISFLNKINYLNACRVSAFGVKVYLMPRMNHAKIMIVDDKECLIGSQNMDVLSFSFNMEIGVFFRHRKLVGDLRKIFDNWKNEAIDFNATHKKITFFDKILITVFKIFYPIF